MAASQAANSQRNGRAPIAPSAAALKKGLSKEAEEKKLQSRSSSEGGVFLPTGFPVHIRPGKSVALGREGGCEVSEGTQTSYFLSL